MNINKYLPHDSISPNILIDPEHLEYPGFSGTGFFCYLSAYEIFFYVTAKHCIKEPENTILAINYGPELEEIIEIDEILTTSTEETNELEDVLIFVISSNISNIKKSILKKRSLPLPPQDITNSLINILCEDNQKVRTLGFPKYDKNTEINYETNINKFQTRAFYGYIKNNSKENNRYAIEELNWSDGDYNGFSGSPVIALPKASINQKVYVVIIGMILTAGNKRCEFLSINIITNAIFNYINNKVNT
ncbi:MAG: hypothetical protein DRG78_11665 [Epsilonproteobacteria bacterium]|nr:MAG: hypothetical protein DRG78_11665 [Campylobacterota bacterium]